MRAIHPTPIAFDSFRNLIPAISKWFLAVLCITGFLHAAHAQTKSKSPEATSTTTVQDPVHTPGARGWSAFTENERRSLDLTDVQLVKLKDMDAGFEAKYKSMGIEPWTNEKFPELNRQRNQAIQDILSPAQYELWAQPSTAVPSTPPTIVPATSPEQ